MALTERQKAFVKEYLVDLNGAKAARRAGYAVDTSRNEATRQLANVHVQAEIQKGMEKRGEKVDLTAERVVLELMKIAFADIKSVASWTANGVAFMPSDDLTDNISAAISEVSEKTVTTKGETSTNLKVKMHDKLKALDMLARHLGMMKDRDEEGPFRAMSLPDLISLVKTKIPELEGKD